jgi:H+-translocating NAD(P) transhydrogenase subunit beta
MSRSDAIRLAYLVAAALFIVGLKRLSSPATARQGNQVAAVGMAIAIVATLVDRRIDSYAWIALGAAVGAVVGAVSARRVQMTAMPQMVALFNGVGGGAAALISLSEYHDALAAGPAPASDVAIAGLFSAAVGAVSFAGSLVAFGKLQGLVTGRPVTWSGQKIVNGALLAAVAVLGVVVVANDSEAAYFAVCVIGLVLGVVGVMAIGGADMPVVISLLNSFTGLAAAATGFVLGNDVLIIAGTLVGASGTLLTQMMSRAMNRSLANVLFGAFGTADPTAPAALPGADGQVRVGTPDDVAVMLTYARRVVMVPGYGLAVAQAQHQLSELATALERRGVDVRYAIHPVAGRMPGHMNVLLAEADVPYTQLYEMDDINPEFPRTDVVLVIGANDVVNPAARSSPGSPIYGMPILNVDEASAVVVLKRGMSTGFAGIENELFQNPKTTMLFGDAKQSVADLIGAVKTA